MGLALVMVEEHARRAVHLRDDHPLGAVDDEGAVVRHQRHIAHVDVLLLDVADGTGSGLVVDIPHQQAQRDLERRRIGHAALLAFLDVVFGQLELVGDELQGSPLGEVLDRKDRPEDLLQARLGPLFGRHVALQELEVGHPLHLDQIGQGHGLGDAAVYLANTFATGKGIIH